MQPFLFLDRITLLNFALILSLSLRYRKFKIICGSLPSDRFLYRPLERYLLGHFDISFLTYQHIDLHGINIPEQLINNFGQLKDNINERAYLCCESLFNQKIVRQRSYKNILEFFNKDKRADSFIKKKLLIEYCRNLVCLFECANLLIPASGEKIKSLFILANDPYDLFSLYKDEGWFRFQPRLLFSKVNNFFYRLQGMGIGLLMPILIIKSNRIYRRLSIRLPQSGLRKKEFWIAPEVHYIVLSNLFKETSSFNSRFSVQQALFIWDVPPAARPQTERYAQEQNGESVVPENLPIPIDYFCRRFLRDICCRLIGRQVFQCAFACGNVFIWRVIFSMVRTVVNYECLLRLCPVKLFLLPRYYEADCAIKTIIVNQAGGLTASLPFGEIEHPMINIFMLAYCCVNHFFLPGEGLGEFQRYAYQVDQFHIVGLSKVDLSIRLQQKRQSLRNKFGLNNSFVITVFGPAYNQTIARRRNVLAFYRAVYSAFCKVRNRQIKLIIKLHQKPDMAEEARDFPELAKLISLFKMHPEVRFYDEHTYQLIALTDFVITWSISTTGIESIASGKKTVYFDPMRSRFHPYRMYHDKLVISNEDEIGELVNSLVEGKFPISEDIYSRITARHGYRNDGKSTQRLLNSLHNIVNDLQSKHTIISQTAISGKN